MYVDAQGAFGRFPDATQMLSVPPTENPGAEASNVARGSRGNISKQANSFQCPDDVEPESAFNSESAALVTTTDTMARRRKA